jgi:hypothetical protein
MMLTFCFCTPEKTGAQSGELQLVVTSVPHLDPGLLRGGDIGGVAK